MARPSAVGFGAVFGQEEKQLNAGDRLILYTDGLIENFGMDGERKGKDRFHAFLENFRHLPTRDLVTRVFEDRRPAKRRGRAFRRHEPDRR